jgi:hypothetical protein
MLDAFGALTKEGLVLGGIASTALSLAVILADSQGQIIGVIAGFGLVSLCGFPVQLPRSGDLHDFVIGTLGGWLMTRSFRHSSPNTTVD